MTKEAYERRKAYQREFQRRQYDPTQRTLKETPRERAIRRKAEGVCTQCGGVLGRSTQLCDRCQDMRIERQRIRREKWRSANLCTTCRKPHLGETSKCAKCREEMNERHKRDNLALRDDVFNAYGGYVCACCGETMRECLTIDHVNNDGGKHRRELANKGRGAGGSSVYYWLKRNNYPPGFQVLCYNCNIGKYRNGGVCPHKEKENA